MYVANASKETKVRWRGGVVERCCTSDVESIQEYNPCIKLSLLVLLGLQPVRKALPVGCLATESRTIHMYGVRRGCYTVNVIWAHLLKRTQRTQRPIRREVSFSVSRQLQHYEHLSPIHYRCCMFILVIKRFKTISELLGLSAYIFQRTGHYFEMMTFHY